MITLHLAKSGDECHVSPDDISVLTPADSGGAIVVMKGGWTSKVAESVTEIRHLINVFEANREDVYLVTA